MVEFRTDRNNTRLCISSNSELRYANSIKLLPGNRIGGDSPNAMAKGLLAFKLYTATFPHRSSVI